MDTPYAIDGLVLIVATPFSCDDIIASAVSVLTSFDALFDISILLDGRLRDGADDEVPRGIGVT